MTNAIMSTSVSAGPKIKKTSQVACVTWMIIIGLFLMMLKFANDKFLSHDAVHVLGGISKVKKMSQGELLLKMDDKFPMLWRELKYAEKFGNFDPDEVISKSFYFLVKAEGEWIDYDGDVHENPQNVIVCRISGKKLFLDVICYLRGKFLLRSSLE